MAAPPPGHPCPHASPHSAPWAGQQGRGERGDVLRGESSVGAAGVWRRGRPGTGSRALRPGRAPPPPPAAPRTHRAGVTRGGCGCGNLLLILGIGSPAKSSSPHPTPRPSRPPGLPGCRGRAPTPPPPSLGHRWALPREDTGKGGGGGAGAGVPGPPVGRLRGRRGYGAKAGAPPAKGRAGGRANPDGGYKLLPPARLLPARLGGVTGFRRCSWGRPAGSLMELTAVAEGCEERRRKPPEKGCPPPPPSSPTALPGRPRRVRAPPSGPSAPELGVGPGAAGLGVSRVPRRPEMGLGLVTGPPRGSLPRLGERELDSMEALLGEGEGTKPFPCL